MEGQVRTLSMPSVVYLLILTTLPLVILVQAENEFSVGATRSPYMQQIIDLYRENGIVIREWPSS